MLMSNIPGPSAEQHFGVLARALRDGDHLAERVSLAELAEIGYAVAVDRERVTDVICSGAGAKERGPASTPAPAPQAQVGPAEGSRPRQDLRIDPTTKG